MGSLELSEDVPEKEPHPTAVEGTEAHELAEKYLYMRYKDQKLDSRIVRDIENKYPDLFLYLDYIQGLVTGGGFNPEIFIENRYFIEWINGHEVFGTADFTLLTNIDQDGVLSDLHIIDLKFGYEEVQAKDNIQLMLYALGAYKYFGLSSYNTASIMLHIVQPRLYSGDKIKRWRISISDIEKFESELIYYKERYELGERNLVAGSHCKWCPARYKCPEIQRASLEVARIEFDDLDKPVDMPSVRSLSDEQVSKLLKSKDILDLWYEDLSTEAHVRLSKGGDISGYKLVRKQTRRGWSNEDEVSCALSDYKQAFNTKLKSIAQLEKTISIPKELYEPFIHKPVSENLVLAKESDRRVGVTPEISTDDFTELD